MIDKRIREGIAGKKWLTYSFEEAAEWYDLINRLPVSEWRREVKRHLVLFDRYYLLVYICNRQDMVHEWLFDRCREVDANPDNYLDLWAREHYKSTIITFAGTIQEILRDPETTIVIFSHNNVLAKSFLKQVKGELERNIELKSLFDDILYEEPKKHAPTWTENKITVKRTNNPKECTVEAYGLVDAMPTGGHYKVRIYDDVVTPKSVSTPEQIKKTTEMWQLSSNLGTDGGKVRYIGTRYHLNDTYNHMMEESIAKPRIYPATTDGTDDVNKGVLRSPAFLAEKKRDQGSYIFSCQMLLNPKHDSTIGFKESDLRFWPARNFRNLNFLVFCDPAGEKKKREGAADPDYTVFWVYGVSGDGNYYTVEIIRDRMGIKRRWETLLRLWRDYRPVFIGYEQYGKDCDIAYLEEKMEEFNVRFDVTAVGGNQVSKPDRIKRLIPIVEENRFFLPERCLYIDSQNVAKDMVQVFIKEEFNKFPVLTHDDMLDCAARILDPAVQYEKPDIENTGFDPIKEYEREMRRNRPVV